jgi:hypothetical protein
MMMMVVVVKIMKMKMKIMIMMIVNMMRMLVMMSVCVCGRMSRDGCPHVLVLNASEDLDFPQRTLAVRLVLKW